MKVRHTHRHLGCVYLSCCTRSILQISWFLDVVSWQETSWIRFLHPWSIVLKVLTATESTRAVCLFLYPWSINPICSMLGSNRLRSYRQFWSWAPIISSRMSASNGFSWLGELCLFIQEFSPLMSFLWHFSFSKVVLRHWSRAPIISWRLVCFSVQWVFDIPFEKLSLPAMSPSDCLHHQWCLFFFFSKPPLISQLFLLLRFSSVNRVILYIPFRAKWILTSLDLGNPGPDSSMALRICRVSDRMLTCSMQSHDLAW